MQMIDRNGFNGEFEFLSNFYESPIDVTRFPVLLSLLPKSVSTVATGEHLYQALKTTDPKWQVWILDAETPRKAKRLGRKAPLRDGWDDGFKLWAMVQTIAAKFSDPELETLLYRTEGELIEWNYWGDTYWGRDDSNGEGRNMLGEVLMMRRALREAV